jgi:hypothetical protein
MVEFTSGEGVRLPTPDPDKKVSQAFAAVRERGMLNASLDVLAKRYEEDNPGLKCRWEFYRPSSDNGEDQVTMREAMGWTLADHANFKDHTESAKKTGIIRRGDLVLMAAPDQVDLDYRMQDAVAAHADLKAPERSYKESLEKRTVKLNDGTDDRAKGVGTIKVQEQLVTPRQTTDTEGGS